ncbi:LacI family DNA-binding transcriptional regulator [Desertivirga arenae]|uniref:LacI family DNA-binding transcriptional regulator n=1 Tax=Desertivirga arenae TaxID=2810309 RepID=UPI001A95E520
MKRKLSIIDIAKHLNISTTTVSFILNGRAKEKRISDELVERVLKFVEEVGYKPNVLARSLRTGKSNIIGLLVESIANPFFANIARLIENNAYKNGYKIIYSSTENDTEKTKQILSIFRERHVDGYIIAPPEGIEEEVTSLIKSGSPVVLFDRFLENVPGVDFVGVNSVQSIYTGMKHLVLEGYKNIGFVTLDSLQSQMQDRLHGYEQATAEFKLTEHVKEVSYNQSSENIVRQIVSFLKRKRDLDAIVFATNYLGISGLRAIKELGLKIPEDIGVLVFDDNELFELYTPSITSIAQPIEKISDQVISLLLKRLDQQEIDPQNERIILDTELTVRDSSSGRK